jgi:hypothetical protein
MARATKAPRPVETLIRGETADERLTMITIQVDHTMHVVEAMAGVLMCLAHAIRDEEEKHPDVEKMPPYVRAAFVRLDEVMRGERA